MQGEIAGVQLCQPGKTAVEQEYAHLDNEPCRHAAQQSLQQAEIQEGTADEGIGGANQLGYLDLVALGKNLQADSVEGNGYQRKAEQYRQN